MLNISQQIDQLSNFHITKESKQNQKQYDLADNLEQIENNVQNISMKIQQNQNLSNHDDQIFDKFKKEKNQYFLYQILKQKDLTIKKKNYKKHVQIQDINHELQLEDNSNQQKSDSIENIKNYILESSGFENSKANSTNTNEQYSKEQESNQINTYQSQEIPLKQIINKLFDNKGIKFNYENWKYQIYEELKQKKYIMVEYLDSGGQANVFGGYFLNDSGIQEDCVIKIYFEQTNKEFKKEIDIMHSFESPINVVKVIDSLQIGKFFILILEKCQYSLKYELKLLEEKKEFSIDKLLQIILDLIDGLIQFRIYNILHLDIKPGNILISREGYYCYSDFGTSQNIKKDQEVEISYFTKYYASPEQLSNQKSMDYQSDVYSLGKTFQSVLKIFKKVNQDLESKQDIVELVQNIERIIDENMIQSKSSERQNCQKLSEIFQKQLKIKNLEGIYSKYKYKLIKILNLYSYDQNKDIPYYLQLKLFYNLTLLNLIKKCQNQKININDHIEGQQQDFQDNSNEIKLPESQQKTKQQFHENHYEIAQSLKNVGDCYTEFGEFQKSLKYYLESLEIKKQIFKETPQLISKTLLRIGETYQNLCEYQIGLTYLFESLEINEQIGRIPEIIESLYRIGEYYLQRGDNQNCLKYFLKSLQISKQNNIQLNFSTLNMAGKCYSNLSDFENGKIYLLESLKILKQRIQGNHPTLSQALAHLGIWYQNIGENENALQYLLESHEMIKQIYEGNHPKIALSLDNVGLSYSKLRQFKNGLKCSLESLEMRKQIYQGNHPEIVFSLNNIGLCYSNMGDNLIGLDYLLQCLETAQKYFSENNFQISTYLNNVGYCYEKLGENQTAINYYIDSLKISKQIFNENHTKIAYSISNIGISYLQLGEKQKSLKYLLESIYMLKQIFKGTNLITSHNLYQVGQLYLQFDNKKKALKYLLKSYDMQKYLFPDIHPIILESLKQIGTLYNQLFKHDNSLIYALEYLEINKINFPKKSCRCCQCSKQCWVGLLKYWLIQIISNLFIRSNDNDVITQKS